MILLRWRIAGDLFPWSAVPYRDCVRWPVKTGWCFISGNLQQCSDLQYSREHLLCPLLISAVRSKSIAQLSVFPYTQDRPPRGKTLNFHCVNAQFIKRIPVQMEGLIATCPLAPNTSHLRLGSCTPPRNFTLDFLQTPPRDDAIALSLTFGSANTWYRDLHPTS